MVVVFVMRPLDSSNGTDSNLETHLGEMERCFRVDILINRFDAGIGRVKGIR